MLDGETARGPVTAAGRTPGGALPAADRLERAVRSRRRGRRLPGRQPRQPAAVSGRQRSDGGCQSAGPACPVSAGRDQRFPSLRQHHLRFPAHARDQRDPVRRRAARPRSVVLSQPVHGGAAGTREADTRRRDRGVPAVRKRLFDSVICAARRGRARMAAHAADGHGAAAGVAGLPAQGKPDAVPRLSSCPTGSAACSPA